MALCTARGMHNALPESVRPCLKALPAQANNALDAWPFGFARDLQFLYQNSLVLGFLCGFTFSRSDLSTYSHLIRLSPSSKMFSKICVILLSIAFCLYASTHLVSVSSCGNTALNIWRRTNVERHPPSPHLRLTKTPGPSTAPLNSSRFRACCT